MKKHILFGMIFSMIFLNSCIDETLEIGGLSSNSGNGGSTDTNLVGMWLLTAIQTSSPHDINGDGEATTDYMAETDCYANELMQFLDDSNGVSTSNSYADITVEIEVPSGDYNYTVDCVEEAEILDFTYTLATNTISFTMDGDTFDGTLNGNQLTILVPEGYEAYNSETLDVEVMDDITFVYTKQ